MYKGQKILGLIPARGGSKGLPKKNIRPLLGKPLIAWTIEKAKGSRYLDRIVVSTDDPQIAKAGRQSGVQDVLMRPDNLATDTAKSIDVIEHAVRSLERQNQAYDYLALLEPTSPLRETKDIDEAIRLLLENRFGAVSLVSVCKTQATHPAFMVRIRQNHLLRPYEKISIHSSRRQDISDLYFLEGTMYLSHIGELLNHRGFVHKKTLAYVVPKWKAFEVDDLVDFFCIEAVLKNLRSIKQRF